MSHLLLSLLRLLFRRDENAADGGLGRAAAKEQMLAAGEGAGLLLTKGDRDCESRLITLPATTLPLQLSWDDGLRWSSRSG